LSNRTRIPLAILALPLLLVTAGFLAMRVAPSASPSGNQAIPIPSLTGNPKSYVQFHVEWTPGNRPSALKFHNLVVNGQYYQVPRGPTQPRGEWNSKQIPNDHAHGKAKASLTITITRPKGYTGRLWLGCQIVFSGGFAEPPIEHAIETGDGFTMICSHPVLPQPIQQ
jgi:hypothetical protein